MVRDEAFAAMFEAAARGCVSRTSRSDGVAFLRAAKDSHGFNSVAYAAINIPAPDRRGLFTHCYFSDRFMHHVVGGRFEGEPPDVHGTGVLTLRTINGERAFLIAQGDDVRHVHDVEELKLLGSYFHAHICRIIGRQSTCDDLSERELDCLQWTAAGKTAWEAGVILGLTERTVRFHLNTAREKLKCATTAQAVAKAVAGGFISA